VPSDRGTETTRVDNNAASSLRRVCSRPTRGLVQSDVPRKYAAITGRRPRCGSERAPQRIHRWWCQATRDAGPPRQEIDRRIADGVLGF